MAKSKNENMSLWESVEQTDPSVTKKVDTRGGFTAITAQSQLKRATEIFGPFGHKWGLTGLKYQYITEDSKVIGVCLVGDFFYPQEGEKVQFDIASDMAYSTKGDCFKKLRTDCITKALSSIGFNSDVFEGKFDDNKYIAEMDKKYGNTKPVKATSKPNPTAIDPKESGILNSIIETLAPKVPEGSVIDINKLKKVILDKFNKFPRSEKSVDVVVKYILEEKKIESVISENDFLDGIHDGNNRKTNKVS